MKKTMIFIAFFVVLVFTVASRTDTVYHACVGFETPGLRIVNCADSSVTELESLRGRYVIVNFWAASDAESRIAASDYDRFAARVSASRLCLLQVYLDSSPALHREIVRRDKLNANRQFTLSSARADSVAEVFNLQSGLQSYLIAPDGKIAAVNPSPETIAQIIGG